MLPVIGILVRDAIYTTEGLQRALGIGDETLREARAENKLRGIWLGKRFFYRGADVMDWIEKEGAPKAKGTKGNRRKSNGTENGQDGGAHSDQSGAGRSEGAVSAMSGRDSHSRRRGRVGELRNSDRN